MAILFDWYENPDSYDKSPEDKILHPRLRLNGSRSTDELRRDIQARCSLTETDVTAVLDAVSHVMGRELAEGRQVHLDGIGYFRVSLTTTEPVGAHSYRNILKRVHKSVAALFPHSSTFLRCAADGYAAWQ